MSGVHGVKRFRMKPKDFLESILTWNALDREARVRMLGGESVEPFAKTDGGFLEDVRFLLDLGLQEHPHRELSVRYAESVYSEKDRDVLLRRGSSEWISADDFLDEVCTFRYYQRFFREPGELSAERLSSEGQGNGFTPSSSAVEFSKKILAFVLTSSRPIEVGAVAKVFDPEDRELFAEGLSASLRLAVLVLYCRRSDLRIGIGIWPELLLDGRVWTSGVALVPREAELIPIPPFLVSDMDSLLVHASFFRLRLRSDGGLLYRRDAERAAEDFADHVPKNRKPPVFPSKRERLANAFRLLLELGFVVIEREGKRRICRPTETGTAWLGLTFREKFVRTVRLTQKDRGDGTKGRMLLDTLAALLGSGKSFGLDDIVEYTVYRWNPWIGTEGLSYVGALERWREEILGCIRNFLFPLGGLKLGFAECQAVVGFSDAGRFLVGESPLPTFDEDSSLLVEIHADCTIATKSPGPERILGRFCDRLGLPGLYRMSEKSVSRAAAEGIPLEVLLIVLENLSGNRVPARARDSLRRWYENVHEIVLLEGTVIECRDRPSVSKFLGLRLRPEPKRVTDRMFLLNPSVSLDELTRLCRLEGISVKGLRSPVSRNNPGPFPPS